MAVALNGTQENSGASPIAGNVSTTLTIPAGTKTVIVQVTSKSTASTGSIAATLAGVSPSHSVHGGNPDTTSPLLRASTFVFQAPASGSATLAINHGSAPTGTNGGTSWRAIYVTGSNISATPASAGTSGSSLNPSMAAAETIGSIVCACIAHENANIATSKGAGQTGSGADADGFLDHGNWTSAATYEIPTVAAGAATQSFGFSGADTWAMSWVRIEPAVPVAQATETDTAQPVARAKKQTIGQTTASSVAQPITSRKTLAIGRVTETDAVQPIARQFVAVGRPVPVAMVNYAPNPTFEDDVAGWEWLEGSTVGIARSAAWSADGTYSLHAARTVTGFADSLAVATAWSVSSWQVGQMFTLKLKVNIVDASAGGGFVQFQIVDINGITRASASIVDLAEGEHEISLSLVVPALKNRANIFVGGSVVADPDSADFYVDKVSVIQGDGTEPYFDYNDPGYESFGGGLIGGAQSREVTPVSDHAWPITRLKTLAVGQATETDTAQAITPALTSGGGQTIAVGRVSETDASQALTARKDVPLAGAAETDTARALAASKLLALARAFEADAAQALAASKSLALVGTTETDTAQAVTAIDPILQSAGQSTETDTAGAMSARKTAAVSQASETDTAVAAAVSPIRRLVVAAIETLSAAALTVSKARSLGQTSETDAAGTVTPEARRLVARATETDTSGGASALKTASIGTVSESDAPGAASATPYRRLAAQASETDVAPPFAASKTTSVNAATETDAAQSASPDTRRLVATATETDAANALTSAKASAVVAALETDSASGTASAKLVALAQALEAETARAITDRTVTPLEAAEDVSTAPPVTPSKSKAIDAASETDAASALAPAKLLAIASAQETDQAQVLTRRKLVLLAAVEDDQTATGVLSLKTLTLEQALEAVDAGALTALRRITIGRGTELDEAGTVVERGTLVVVEVLSGPTEPRISDKPLHRTTEFTWQTDHTYAEFQVRIVDAPGDPHTAGVALPATFSVNAAGSGAYPALTPVTTTVDGRDAHGVVLDDDYYFKVFVRSGITWSE